MLEIGNSLLLIAFLIACSTITSYCEFDCETYETCRSCLERPQCVWCRKMADANGPAGCISRENANEACATESFIEDTLVNFKFIQNDPLTIGSSDNPILLRPQKIHLSNMRKGKVYNVSVTFRQVVDYPVDLYFVMDVSNTMINTTKYLGEMSSSITSNMRTLTKKVAVGFGTFVDKNTPPFAKSDQNPYTFKNVLGLTDNITKFQEDIRETKSVRNHDPAESVLDAALQAIVCFDEIKWRKEARKIIIVATDALPHVAGNGKVAGISKPNDGKCHLNASNIYDMALEQDYASFGLMVHTIKKHSVNVILALKRQENRRKPYESLASLVKGSIDVVGLNETSLVSTVENQYRQIASKVQLVHNPLEFVKVTYYSSCVNDSLVKRNECEQLQLNKEVDFTIGVEVIECPPKMADRKQTLVVKAYGYQDTVTIDIDINCYCPCEKADNQTCPSRCDDFRPCVQCEQASDDGQTSLDGECSKCSHLAKFIPENEPIQSAWPSERKCETPIQDVQTGCETDFKYGYDDDAGQIVVRYIGNQRCPPPFPLATASFSLMGGIVAIGIILILVWRLLLYLYDRKEYARFVEESKKANWNTGANPLYVGASTTIQNPAFNSTPE